MQRGLVFQRNGKKLILIHRDDFLRTQQKKFDQETQKMYQHLKVKLMNQENKLKIRMNKEFDVLRKKIALHE